MNDKKQQNKAPDTLAERWKFDSMLDTMFSGPPKQPIKKAEPIKKGKK